MPIPFVLAAPPAPVPTFRFGFGPGFVVGIRPVAIGLVLWLAG